MAKIREGGGPSQEGAVDRAEWQQRGGRLAVGRLVALLVVRVLVETGGLGTSGAGWTMLDGLAGETEQEQGDALSERHWNGGEDDGGE